MKPLRLALLSLLTGLSLSACLEPQALTGSDPGSLAGGVAFHLTGSDSASLAGTVDSVRLEATRSGYPVHGTNGSLRETTRLSELEPGTWTLRVALFDTAHAIRWSGDTVVEIQAGRTSDALVRLHPAKGAVNVRIVLDSSTQVLDTLPVQFAQWTNEANWGLEKAWRTSAGLFLVGNVPGCPFRPQVHLGSHAVACDSAKECLIPFLPLVDSSLLVLSGFQDPAVLCAVDTVLATPEVVHFVPWTRSGPVTLRAASGDLVFPDPSPQAADSAFRSYDLNISGFMPQTFHYALDASGRVTRTTSSVLRIDSAILPDVRTASLPSDSFVVAVGILQSAAVRHPVPLTEAAIPPVDTSLVVRVSCPSDAPYSQRVVRYADGKSADLSWGASNFCWPLPAGWQELRRVDAMLQALFEPGLD